MSQCGSSGRSWRSKVSRRSTATVVALVGALALAACGSTSSSSTPGAGSSSAAPATVTVWDPFYDLSTSIGKAQKQIDDDFMKAYPNITIQHQLHGWDTIFTQLQAAITANRGPDVFLMYGGSFANDFKRGLVPLDSKFDADTALKGSLQYVDVNRTDGQLLVLPLGTYTSRIQYNKTLFKKAGLDPDKPPTTWDEFLAACAKLKASGTIPIAAGFKDGYYGEWLTYATTPQTATREQALAGYNGKLSYTDTSVYRDAYQPIVDLAKLGYFTPNSESIPSAPDPLNSFEAGKAAIVIATDSDMRETGKAIGEENLGIMRMPIIPNSLITTQSFDGGSNLSFSIGKWSPNQDAAYTYLSYLVGAQSQTTAYNVGSIIPNMTGVNVTSDLPAQSELLGWQASTPDPNLLIGFGAQTEAVFDKRIPQVIAGTFSLDDMLSELEETRLQALSP